MKTIFVKDIKNYLGEEIHLRGWVSNIRKSGKLMFIIFRDGTGTVQAVVYKPGIGEEKFELSKTLTIESSVEIWGKPKEHPNKPGVYELDVTDLKPISIAPEYPIGKKEHGPDFLLSNRHLWLRSPKQRANLRVRHVIYRAIGEYLNEQSFTRFDSPILTPNACEGSTTLFELEYFDQGLAYLSQSGQLYLEPAIMSLGRVYDFGPVFRAEKSKTRKHLTEFWMMDAEAAFVEHKENMQIQEGLIRNVIRTVIKECPKELEILERDVDQLKKADAPFKIMTHFEAIEYLQSKGCEIAQGEDFGASEEAILTEGSDVPIFIEKWPKKIKAFYMKQDPENPELVLGSDLIAPEGFGEIIGGSEREDNYDILLARMEEEGLDIKTYDWYLDTRKYGSVPHSGFGIGLERLVQWMTGTKHIREVIPFPRMIYRIYP